MLVLNEKAEYVDIWVPSDLEVLFQERERYRQEVLLAVAYGQKGKGMVSKQMAKYITRRIETLIRRVGRKTYVQQA
jgi:hypothetical protein